VHSNGTVEFAGQRFSNPSKLAVAMVNANGGKAKALNGYDYIFVQTTTGPRSLADLRELLLNPDLAA
jgi:hypothetical protein